MLSSWLRKTFRPFSRSVSSDARPSRMRVPLRVEQLEDRIVPAIFTNGDVVLGLSNGTVEVHHPDGTLVATLDVDSDLDAALGSANYQARGGAFDDEGNFYVTDWTPSHPAVAVYDPNGAFVEAIT